MGANTGLDIESLARNERRDRLREWPSTLTHELDHLNWPALAGRCTWQIFKALNW